MSALPLEPGFGEAAMDGPNTHKMDAPRDVTSWTVIPTTRDVVTADGRGFESRDEWWHVPTFVAEAIEHPALPSAPDHRLREALTDVQFAHRHLLGDSDVTREDASAILLEVERTLRAVLSEATPSSEPDLDVDVLARAICASRDPQIDVEHLGFIDDECRALARSFAAAYARLSASQTPDPDIK